MRPRSSPRARLPIEEIVLIGLLALVPVVFSRLTQECFEVPQCLLLTTGALVLFWRALSLLLAGIGRHGPARHVRSIPGRVAAWARRDPLGAGVILFLGSSIASTITSPNPALSLHGAPDSTAGLVAAFATATVYFASRAVSRGQPVMLVRFARAAGFASLVTSLYALVQLLGWDPLVWGRTATFEGDVRVFGTLGHPNMLGAYLAMTVPLMLWLALGSRSTAERIGWGLCVTIAAIVIAATLSRGAWIGLVAGALTWAVLTLGPGLRSGGTARARGQGRASPVPAALWISLLVAGLAAFLFARAPMGAHLADRVRQITSTSAPTTRSRLLIWQAGLLMARDHPALGVGVDAFGITYPRYRDPRYWEIEFGGTPNKAHSEPIQILAAQGIVGGLAALAVIALVALAAGRAVTRKESAIRGGAIAATASLVAFAAQDLMSFTVVALGSLAAAMAGWLSSAAVGELVPSERRDPGKRKRERVPAWAMGLALVPAAFLLAELVYLPLRAQLQEKRAMKAPLGSQDRAWALTQASRYAPWDARYENLLGASLLAQSGREPDPERKRDLLRQAATAFRSAIATEPENPYFHSNLGRAATAQAALRPPEATAADARRAFDEAMRRDPVNAQVMDQESMALLALGKVSEARRVAERSIAIYPELAQPLALFGYMALLDERWGDARDTLELAVRREWFGEKDARAASWSNLSAAYLALGRNEEGLRAAEEGLSFNPQNPDARANRDLARLRLDAAAASRGAAGERTGTVGGSR
jgi:putative inorganic carbon (HCO3(-)) transporter